MAQTDLPAVFCYAQLRGSMVSLRIVDKRGSFWEPINKYWHVSVHDGDSAVLFCNDLKVTCQDIKKTNGHFIATEGTTKEAWCDAVDELGDYLDTEQEHDHLMDLLNKMIWKSA